MMAHDLAHICGLVFDRPHAIAEGKLNDILAVIGNKIQFGDVPPVESRISAASGISEDDVPPTVAIIPIQGTLVNRGGWIGAQSGLTAYEGTRAALDIALADNTYDAIILDVDSFGGESSGMVDLANDIREADSIKPVYAIVNSHALSAGYGIASAARKVFATSTSLVGSIGVIAAHRDQSKFDEKVGLKYTFVTAGKDKAMLSSHAPLSDKAEGWLQARVDETYGDFVALVSRNRGLSEETVRGTEAGIYSAGDAAEVGLVDEVMPADEAIGVILKEVTMKPKANDDKSLETGAKAEQPESGNGVANDIPDNKAGDGGDTPTAEAVQEQIEQAVSKAKAEVRTEERQRVAGIFDACNTMNRPELAKDFIDQGMTVEEARAALFDKQASETDAVGINSSHSGDAPDVNEIDQAALSILNAGKEDANHG